MDQSVADRAFGGLVSMQRGGMTAMGITVYRTKITGVKGVVDHAPRARISLTSCTFFRTYETSMSSSGKVTETKNHTSWANLLRQRSLLNLRRFTPFFSCLSFRRNSYGTMFRRSTVVREA